MDVDRFRLLSDQGLDADMFADSCWTRNVRGQRNAWLIRGHEKNAEYLWKFPGRCAFHAELPRRCPEILWMIHRMLPGRQAGHHADCFMSANLSAA